MKPCLIVLDGLDGVGKSTVQQALAHLLMDEGSKVYLTREPGGTPFGERVRELLLSEEDLAPETEVLLMQAQRQEHLDKVILPKLKEEHVVICDRFLDSTYVYNATTPASRSLLQATSPHLPLEDLRDNTLHVQLMASDGVIRKRMGERGLENRLDSLSDEVLFARRNAFKECAWTRLGLGERIITIPVDHYSPEEVAVLIVTQAKAIFKDGKVGDVQETDEVAVQTGDFEF